MNFNRNNLKIEITIFGPKIVSLCFFWGGGQLSEENP